MFLMSWIQLLSNRMTFNRNHRRGSRTQSRRSTVACQHSVVSPLTETLEQRSLLSTFYVDDTFANPTAGQDPDGAGPATNFGTDSFATIQGAVVASSSGDTVDVAAGTYNEMVVVDKSLTLLGAQASVDARTRLAVSESIVSNGKGDFQILANNVVIDGFTITGVNVDSGVDPTSLGAGVWTPLGAAVSGYVLKNNIIQDNILGVYANSNGAASIESNLFLNNDTAGAVSGGIYSEGTVSLTIDNNEFANHTAANPVLFGATATISHTTLQVTNNSLHDNTGATGIFVLSVSSGLFQGNEIDTAGDATGLSLSGSNTNIDVLNNIFNNNLRGVRVIDYGYFGSAPNSDIRIHNNAFTNNVTGPGNYSLGVQDDGGGGVGYAGGVLDASSNYWGSSDPATVAGMISVTIPATLAGSVDFTSLLDNNETDPTVGFQADHSSLTVHTLGAQTTATGRIQEAIDLLADGSLIGGNRTINVAAGTFAENVVVHKSLTLDGSGALATDVKIQPAAGVALTTTVAAATVTVRDLQLTGTGTGLSATGQTTLTLNDVANDATTGGSVSTVTAFNYTAGPGADVISASATSLSNTGALPFNSVALSLIGSLTVDGAAGNDTITVTPSATGGTAITANGGADTDTLIYNATGGSPTVTPTTITQAGKQDVNYATMENISLVNVVGPVAGQGTNGADTFEVRNNMGTVEFRTNGGAWVAVTTGPLNITGGTGDDSLILDFAGGNAIPTGGLTYDGGVGGNDNLAIHGDHTQTVIYTPDAVTNGSGVIMVNGSTMSFSNLEPVDFDNVGAFSMVLAGANDIVDLANGFNSAVTAGAEPIGTVPALVISGTSGGVGFEAAHVFRTASVTVVTTTVAGDDTITITSANNAHLNSALTITAGLEAADTITVNGIATFSGTTTLNARTISLNENITNAVTGSTATLMNVTAPGQIQDGVNVAASVATLNVAAGTYAEVADLSTKAITLAPGVAPAQVNVNGVTLTADDTLNIQIGGTTPGNTATNYDQLNVAGTVNLGNATLNLTAFNGFIPANGDTFVIVGNDDVPLDAVIGTFLGLPEGATINNFLGVTGLNAVISYTGGTGNDVVITVQTRTVTLGISSALLVEAGDTTTVTATLSAVSAQNVIVNLAFSGTATNLSDYSRSGVQIVIPAGSTSGTITLTTVQDLLNETNETIVVDISSVIAANEFNTQQVTATILDDDVAPSVTLLVSPPSISETGGLGSVTAVLSALSGQDVTVTLFFSGTAADGTDYTHPGATIVIAAGTLSNSLNLTAVLDTLDEANETIVVDIFSVTNGTELGIQQGSTIILDDDPTTATLSINDFAVTEGNAGPVLATFTVTLSAASGQMVTVNAATADNTAVALGDYTSVPTTLITFLPGGPLTQTVTVAVNGDTLDEINETYFVNLSNAINATITDAQGLGTITDDDDATATLSINDVTVTEGNFGPVSATFTVTLSAVSGQTVTVNAATANITAIAPGDYLAVPTTLVTFAPGQTTQSVTLQVNGDTLNEINETFSVNLSGALNATIADVQGIGTITDDDVLPIVTLLVTPPSISETGGLGAVTATLSALSGQDVTVTLTFSGTAADGIDYSHPGSTIVIPAGSLSNTLLLTALTDTLDEANETIVVDIFSVTNGTELGIQQGFTTILDDDVSATVTLLVAPAIVPEPAGPITVTATLSALSGQDVTVNLAFSGTAADGVDYTHPGATIVIAANTLSNTLTLTVVNDVLDETIETVVVDISSVTNATELGVQQGISTITDNDATPTLSINDVEVAEGDDGFVNAVFTVTLSATSGQTVTVVANSADGTATSPSDYLAFPATTLTFAPGETTKTVTVLVRGDTAVEASETYTVILSSPSNATIADALGEGTITNDDVFDPTTVSGFVGLVDDPENVGRQMLLVVGTILKDVIHFRDRLYGQQIQVILNNVNVGVFDNNWVSRIVVYGLAGNDHIHVYLSLGKATELHGNEGDDSLYGGVGRDELFGGEGNDYLNGRSGLDRLYGEDGNDRLYGENGHDILLGGSGNDRLYGGNDRDILIGGIGTDTLYGQNGDDILIGGETTHDDNVSALNAILSEWTSGNTYADRVANIRDGSGDLPGQNDGTFFNDGTVLDDGEVDQLFGGGNQDWFFKFDNDALKDKRTSSHPKYNELVN